MNTLESIQQNLAAKKLFADLVYGTVSDTLRNGSLKRSGKALNLAVPEELRVRLDKLQQHYAFKHYVTLVYTAILIGTQAMESLMEESAEPNPDDPRCYNVQCRKRLSQQTGRVRKSGRSYCSILCASRPSL